MTLHLYDLSGGLAKQMSMAFVGKQFDGIWHTGIVVYGQEYYFGGGICSGPPGMTPYGNPVQKIPLGNTELPKELFIDFLKDISPGFTVATYNIFTNNCNNFTDVCANFLVGEGIPAYIVNLPQEFQSTPMGSQMMGMFGNMNNPAMNGTPLFDPRAMEGGSNPQALNFNNQTTQGDLGGVNSLLDQQSFTQLIQRNDACVVDVFTNWCGPCKAIKPFFNTLPAKYPDLTFAKIDLDCNRFLATTYGINSIPTFLYFYKGKSAPHPGNLVKKQNGANQQSLVNNINWLKSNYVREAGETQQPQDAPQAQGKQDLTLKVFKQSGEPFFFATENWHVPAAKVLKYLLRNKETKALVGDDLKKFVEEPKTFVSASF